MVEQVSSLKTGVKYKKTPIGKIPVNWEVAKLSELAIIKKNAIVDGDWIEIKDQSSSGYRLLQVGNIGVGQLNLGGNFRYVSEETIKRLNCTVLQKGYLLISRMPDPIGRACLMEELDYKCITVVDCTIVKLDPQKVDSSFVVFFLNSQPALNRAKVLATGTTRQRISRKELEGVPLIAPSLPEQKEIAEILTTVDDAIEKTNQIIDKTKELKKGLMQRLLTRGIGHKKFKKSEIGEIPVGWELKRLSDLCIGKPEYGANTPAIDKTDHLPRYIRITDITKDGKLLASTWQSIETEFAKGYMLKEGDLLFARSGATVGKSYLFRKEGGACAFAGYLIRFKPNTPIFSPDFLFHFTHSYIYYNWVKRMLRAGAQPNINAKEYSNMKVPSPPIKEQKRIVAILNSIDDQLEKELNHKDQLNLLKKGLMQVLLTGRLRVRV